MYPLIILLGQKNDQIFQFDPKCAISFGVWLRAQELEEFVLLHPL